MALRLGPLRRLRRDLFDPLRFSDHPHLFGTRLTVSFPALHIDRLLDVMGLGICPEGRQAVERKAPATFREMMVWIDNTPFRPKRLFDDLCQPRFTDFYRDGELL